MGDNALLSIVVLMEVTMALPTDEPSCKAELNMAPTVPAICEGVQRNMAILHIDCSSVNEAHR